MRFYWLTLGMLCTWRITHLLQAEDGPWDVVVRIRHGLGSGFWGSLLDCFQCLSLWIAAPLAYLIGEGWGERFVLWPALSAGAILLETVTGHPRGTAPASYEEDREVGDVVLREAKAGDLRRRSGRSGGRDT